MFFLAQPQAEPGLVLAGSATWAFGLSLFFCTGLAWRRERASPVGPLAALLVLPPAFFGALLLTGLVAALVDGPAHYAQALVTR